MLVEILLSLLLGTVFLASAVPKLRRSRSFTLTVLEYRVLPPVLGRLYARLLPGTELFVALLFLAGTAVRLAAVVSSLLLISFIVGISVNIARGRDLDCGCFGAGRRGRIGWPLLLEDAGLLAVAAVLGIIGERVTGPSEWSVFVLPGAPLGRGPAGLLLCLSVAAGITSVSILSQRRPTGRQPRPRRSLPDASYPARGGDR